LEFPAANQIFEKSQNNRNFNSPLTKKYQVAGHYATGKPIWAGG
jgi:hypothetical protein